VSRASGRPGGDHHAYTAAGLAFGAGTAAAAWLGWGPTAVATWLLCTAAAIPAAQVLGLRAGLAGPAGRPDRPALRRTVRTAVLMGLPVLTQTAAVSAVFAIVAALAPAAQSSYLYVAFAVFNLLHGVGDYLLRVYQPQVTLRLAGATPEWVAGRVRRLVLVVGLGGPAYLAACAWAVGALTPDRAPGWVAPTALLVLALPVVFGAMLAGYLLENHTDASLLVAGLASLAALPASALAAVLLAPGTGAEGGVVALAAGHAAVALGLLVPSVRRVRTGEPGA